MSRGVILLTVFKVRWLMKIAQKAPENGFTLVELLIVCSTILILSGLALQAFFVYKDRAYHEIAMQLMGDARIALEAGKIDAEQFPDQTLLVDQNHAGLAVEGDAAVIAPGLVLPENCIVHIAHNPQCLAAGCVEDLIVTRHCKAKTKVLYTRIYQLGEVTLYSAADSSLCS